VGSVFGPIRFLLPVLITKELDFGFGHSSSLSTDLDYVSKKSKTK
jgi:hypothetical protein